MMKTSLPPPRWVDIIGCPPGAVAPTAKRYQHCSADVIHAYRKSTPEVRQWTGEYERAWQAALDAKYGISKRLSLAEVIATAEERKGSEVPVQRVLKEVKGDITSLYF